MPEETAMRVEIVFRADVPEERGASMARAVQITEQAFTQCGLRCTVEPGGLTAYGRGAEDFSSLWRVVLALLGSPWLADCAAKCLWHDEDGTTEDLLSQAWKVR